MHYHNHTNSGHSPDTTSQFSLAHSATWHCLMGCGLGEIVGVVIGTALGLRPLLRAGFDFSRAIHQVFVAESLSIVVMEATEVLVQVVTPGVMEAGLGHWMFWLGMTLALTAGYVAAFPVNYVLLGKGIRQGSTRPSGY